MDAEVLGTPSQPGWAAALIGLCCGVMPVLCAELQGPSMLRLPWQAQPWGELASPDAVCAWRPGVGLAVLYITHTHHCTSWHEACGVQECEGMVGASPVG